MSKYNLNSLGWNKTFEVQLDSAEKGFPARVINKNRGHYLVLTESGQFDASLSGKYMHESNTNVEYPAVGDWVLVNRKMNQHIIYKLLNRKSAFVRRQKIDGGRTIINGVVSGGTTQEQILASNIDTVFIMTGLDKNFNHKRIERYLTLCLESGASPVILLNKLDLCDDIESKVFDVQGVSLGYPIHAISAINDQGMEQLRPYLGEGKTVTFLGSSGVGKSTISNFLLGENVQPTKHTNEQTSKGVHTTTTAQLLVSKDGTLIIDTPGLREIQLWCEEETVDTSFEEITALMENCRYNSCTHQSELGCAVREALQSGELPADRYMRYQKMLREVRYLINRKKGVEMKLNKRVKQYEKRNSEKKYINAYEK